MPYFVVDLGGNAYGPADLPLLQQWVAEGRVTTSTTLRDAVSGQTMMATAIPGLFPGGAGMGASPYGPNPYAAQQPLGQPSGYYPRPTFAANSNDTIVAWVLSAVGIICAFCVCALVGIPFGIGGVVFARRALAGGDSRAQGALITSYVAIGISSVMLIIGIIGLIGMRS